MGPAHFPELKPQHADAQSASFVQAPVMNCVPGAVVAAEVVTPAAVTVSNVDAGEAAPAAACP